jgi:hypothetical protein
VVVAEDHLDVLEGGGGHINRLLGIMGRDLAVVAPELGDRHQGRRLLDRPRVGHPLEGPPGRRAEAMSR